ncbi:site-specific integrase [Streptomyces sp. A7024]|uniref:Site-specific integrase n=1 Tax=Streptomyces coryli TaxID=1128680 RepID=A0A6G4TSQ0_9ACTN|nr:site-specific integrase [Streptomyces coryli]NGN62570.1 site-specific integrase [Streptomyces coryli]
MLARLLEAERTGIDDDPRLRVDAYLLEWLHLKEQQLKPTTYRHYRQYVHRDLIPAFGRLRLTQLRPRHISAFTDAQLAAGRGRTTVYRCTAALSSALGHAVRIRLLAHNPAAHSLMPRPVPPERLCWSPEQSAAFLVHNHAHYGDRFTDLFEVLLGTGLRRGEALGLHWADVYLAERVLFVRWTLTAIDNNALHLGPPKTKASRNWVALAPRVARALHRQAALQMSALPPGAPLEGLVFAASDGAPLRPQYVLEQLRRRAEEAGVPRIGVHDLRHTAATIMLSSGVPLAVVSKTLRHSTLATTVNIYGHLLKHAARDAVTTLGHALDQAGPNPGGLRAA